MTNNNRSIVLIITILVLSFIFALGLVGFSETPAENKTDAPREDRITKGLDSLIEKGIIKAEDVDKIKDYLQAERIEKRKIFDQTRNMSEEQRKEFIKNYKKNKINVIDKMVRDKVITKEQAEEIRKIMPRHKGCKKKH